MTIIRYKGYQINIQDENYHNPASIQINPGAALTITKIVLPLALFVSAVIPGGIYAAITSVIELSTAQAVCTTAALTITGGAIGNYLLPRTPAEELGAEHINAVIDSIRFTYDWSFGAAQEDNDVTPAGDNNDLDLF
ncbi:MAG: hypothetical protein NWS20_05610 [Rickettsiaceae bacterium]|nr:hypothetical protein [Rickettsiaceae bacterium]MDP4832714.1 hypothetical protein [Rickettsiaceae bacterium]MDP5021138.1 hypothetical protein [Rickettsiaceae bacterium]